MSANSVAFYSQQYSSVVELLSQQVSTKIANTFTPMAAEGKAATVVDQIGNASVNERTTRYAPIVPGNITHTRPWVFPKFFDAAELFDTIDKLKMNASPESAYVQALVAAMNRQMDIEANAAFWADRMVGENGTTTESFAAAQQIGVNVGGTSSGLNVEKLQNGLEVLRAADVDTRMEKLFCVISPRQERNLMNEMEVTSSDFTTKRVLDAGGLDGQVYMGINFIVSNRLAVDGSSLRRVPLYTSKGMTFCTWGGGMNTKVSQRDDLSGQPWQCYVSGNFGAVRREAAKVVEIKCAE